MFRFMKQDDSRSAQQRGLALLLEGKFAEAIAAFDNAISLEPRNRLAWTNKGVALLRTERFQEALMALDQACALDPQGWSQGRTLAFVNRLQTLIRLDRFDEAVEATGRMLEYSRRDSSVWLVRGEALAGQKRYGEAEEAFLAAVGLATTKRYAYALSELGYFYLNKTPRDFDKAMDVCARLFESPPDHNIAWRLKGAILIECQRYQEALIACEEAIAHGGLALGNPMRLWNSYGVALLFSGRCGDALTALDRAAAAVPGLSAPPNTRGLLFGRLVVTLRRWSGMKSLPRPSPPRQYHDSIRRKRWYTSNATTRPNPS
jgi:tetratricopeptide (TPR) repeat protein